MFAHAVRHRSYTPTADAPRAGSAGARGSRYRPRRMRIHVGRSGARRTHDVRRAARGHAGGGGPPAGAMTLHSSLMMSCSDELPDSVNNHTGPPRAPRRTHDVRRAARGHAGGGGPPAGAMTLHSSLMMSCSDELPDSVNNHTGPPRAPGRTHDVRRAARGHAGGGGPPAGAICIHSNLMMRCWGELPDCAQSITHDSPRGQPSRGQSRATVASEAL